jgi:uncharacterized membrane protein
MSDLIVIGYETEKKAEHVLDELLALENEDLVDLEDAAVLSRNAKGHLKVTTRHRYVAGAGLTGVFWGVLVGLLFVQPLAGAAIGGITGLIAGAADDLDMKADFKEDAGALVQPGTSAVMAFVRKATPDKVLAEIGRYGGTVLRTSLDYDDEAKLADALRAGTAAAA